MTRSLDCFLAYDIRGRVPDQLDEEIAYRIGRAFAVHLGAERVVIGHDIRLSGPALAEAVARGLNDGGAEVFELGTCGTEEVYFATFHQRMDGGIMVTASHNPRDYNGMKLVGAGARPLSGDSGLAEIRALAESGDFPAAPRRGGRHPLESRPDYLDHLLGYLDPAAVPPLKVVLNPGNGGAGLVLDPLLERLPIVPVKVHYQADGDFPNGVPNPLLPDHRHHTADAVRETGADLGVAWDGDFDRCFFFDEQGEFVDGYYMVGLLASELLRRHPGAAVVHDPRLTWNSVEMIEEAGGRPVRSKAGHAFIKERMRAEDALYGGEISAHHFFRDFAYCDSGMIPMLMVLELLGRSGQPLSQLVAERQARFPASGELNRRVADPAALLAEAERRYGGDAVRVDHDDGLSLEFPQWRFNLRASNTEPMVRLNVESRGDRPLMEAKTEELLRLMDQFAAPPSS